jgi:indole-3-glycerol phosphate synthase
MNGSFLEEVVGHVRADSASPRYELGVPPRRQVPPRSLRSAVERQARDGALVVEYKRGSPGYSGALPPARTIPEFLRATRAVGVAAYSCLATAHRFDGAPARVAELALATPRPVLFKEFVLNVRQLDIAARCGAAAVLLVARLEAEGFVERPLAELAREAHRRGLEVLLEMHDAEELSRADGVAADVFGVNVRNLATLELERPVAHAAIDLAVRRGLRPLLGLSGVESAKEASAFWSRGCDGILVGTAVALASDPRTLLAGLRRTAPGAS